MTRSPKSSHTNQTPKCNKCHKNLTAVKYPGVVCSDCKIAFHRTCTTITDANWTLYSRPQNPKVFLCVDCLKTQRRLSLYAATAAPTTSPLPKTKTTPAAPSKKPAEATRDDDLKALRDQLTQVLQELKEAKARIAQLEARKVDPKAAEAPTLAEGTSFFTINGIPKTDGEEVNSITETILSLKSPNFKLDGTATVTRLVSNSETHHSILIGVRRGSPLYQTFKKARGSRFKGEEAGFPAVRHIYVNESHTSLSYRLFKKAKALKELGFQFVWIRSSRVFARKTAESKVIPINNDDVLEKLLNPQG